MTSTRFGTAPDGRPVHRLDLRAGELRIGVLDWGAILQDVRLTGIDWPLTAGSPDFPAYLGPMCWFGAIVGPVANRIGGARALVGDRVVCFEPNEGGTLLHSGLHGTQSRLWQIVRAGTSEALLRLDLPHDCDGFPGNRHLEAGFRVEAPAILHLSLTAVSDRPTLMNPANHSYWTLDPEPGVAGQRLSVAAGRWLPTQGGLPTGEIAAPLGRRDLRRGRVLDPGEAIDHNFCLADAPHRLAPAASLTGRKGLRLDLATTAPGLQVYTGQALDSAPFPGHHGRPYKAFDAIALEPQFWPDAPNHPGFPSILLRPGETFRQDCRFSFTR